MPRSAARLFLRVTGVKAQRVRNISTKDVVAEGIDVESAIDYETLTYAHPDIKNADAQTIADWQRDYAQKMN
jgi:hypothetical protein